MLAGLFDGQGVLPKNIEEKFANDRISLEIIKRGLEILDPERRNLFSLPEEELLRTMNVQPAIFLYDLAQAVSILVKYSLRPDYLAGHSLGEYAALVIAGVLKFETAFRLVIKRGELMEETSQKHKGSMGVVFSEPLKSVEAVCRRFSQEDYAVSVANINSASQITFSGPKDLVETVVKYFRMNGKKSFILKKVKGAWHSALMKEAEENLAKEIEKVKFNKASIPLIINGQIYTKGEEIKRLLQHQMTTRVNFYASILKMAEIGVEAVAEFGPSDILGHLVQESVPSIKVIAF